MKIYWPRRAPGLPPGQRLMSDMPRFTDRPLAAPPAPGPMRLKITVDREVVGEITEASFRACDPTDFVADFHCVTTWSVTGLNWTGVRLRDLMASLGLDEGTAPYIVARAADRRRGHFVAADAISADVIVATHLNGDPLGQRHGGPLRLVAPAHYAYKSIKHLVAIEFRNELPDHLLGKEHLRGRVAHQERHPTLPSWLVRLPYRLLIPPTAWAAERSLRSSERG